MVILMFVTFCLLQVWNVRLLSGGVRYNNSLGHFLSSGFSYQGESTNCCGDMFLEHVQTVNLIRVVKYFTL